MILDTDLEKLLRAIQKQVRTATKTMTSGILVGLYKIDEPGEHGFIPMTDLSLEGNCFTVWTAEGIYTGMKADFKALREEDGYNFSMDDGAVCFRFKRVVPTHLHEVRVYTGDTDAYGTVYYAKMLHYMEAARVEMFRNHGIQPSNLEKLGLDFLVVGLEIKYPAPARLDDLLEVRTKLLALDGDSLQLDQSVWRDDVLCYDAYVKLTCISAENRKVTRIPHELRKLLGIRPLTNE